MPIPPTPTKWMRWILANIESISSLRIYTDQNPKNEKEQISQKDLSVKIRVNPLSHFLLFLLYVPQLLQYQEPRSDAPDCAPPRSCSLAATDLATTPKSFLPARRLPISILRQLRRLLLAPALRHSLADDRRQPEGMERKSQASLPLQFLRPCSRLNGILLNQRAQTPPACLR